MPPLGPAFALQVGRLLYPTFPACGLPCLAGPAAGVHRCIGVVLVSGATVACVALDGCLSTLLSRIHLSFGVVDPPVIFNPPLPLLSFFPFLFSSPPGPVPR